MVNIIVYFSSALSYFDDSSYRCPKISSNFYFLQNSYSFFILYNLLCCLSNVHHLYRETCNYITAIFWLCNIDIWPQGKTVLTMSFVLWIKLYHFHHHQYCPIVTWRKKIPHVLIWLHKHLVLPTLRGYHQRLWPSNLRVILSVHFIPLCFTAWILAFVHRLLGKCPLAPRVSEKWLGRCRQLMLIWVNSLFMSMSTFWSW